LKKIQFKNRNAAKSEDDSGIEVWTILTFPYSFFTYEDQTHELNKKGRFSKTNSGTQRSVD